MIPPAELKNLRSLTGSGLLSALSVILNQFTIFFSQVLRVSFTFLPIALSGMLYGPVLTGSLGAVVDILKYFTRNDGGAFSLALRSANSSLDFCMGCSFTANGSPFPGYLWPG